MIIPGLQARSRSLLSISQKKYRFVLLFQLPDRI